MKAELVIFDLDGTLIDSLPDIVHAVNSVAMKNQFHTLTAEQVRPHVGLGVRSLLRSYVPNLEPDSDFEAQLMVDFFYFYRQHHLKNTDCFVGVRDYLDQCEHKIAIVTNKPKDLTDEVIAHLKLDRYPWVSVFGADSFDKKKPDPLPLRETMKLAQVEPDQTVMIGDGIPDIHAAQQAGVKVVAVEYGYGSREELGVHNPDTFISGIGELAGAIKTL